MAKSAGRQTNDAVWQIADEESLLDDFSDLESHEDETIGGSLDDIETMLIDINEEPYSDDAQDISQKPLSTPQERRSLFEPPKVKQKKRININQRLHILSQL